METYALTCQHQGQTLSLDMEQLPALQTALRSLDQPLYLTQENGALVLRHAAPGTPDMQLAYAPVLLPQDLGDPAFKRTYGTHYALYTGSMANAISSEALVSVMGQAGMMGAFGAGGLLPDRIERAIDQVQAALPHGPYIFNLINSPNEPALEARTADLYIRRNLPVIEASAYLGITINLAWYRATGLSPEPDGSVRISHRVIAKVSRKEIAQRFMQPAPEDLLNQLLGQGKITAQQAELARRVPMADDVTVEADSGGHTDNRPLVNALPAILQLRDSLQDKYSYAQPVRIGAAGGIATPAAALAAFMMGAAYVTSGSINQACVESGASDHTRKLLAGAEMTDVAMAPASDMFEMGVRVQVLKRGTMFAMRGQKLYEIYSRYNSIEEIPGAEREKLESGTFQMGLEQVWQECLRFFSARDPQQIERAEKDPKAKMALIFRWYLGLSSRWSNIGEKGREMDYQVWCGPAMGAFNDWVRGTYLETVENRRAADANLQILTGAAYLYRLRMLEAQGVRISPALARYSPQRPLV